MCDPLTIAGIALTAGSTLANTMAQRSVQKKRDEALAAERIRQRGLDQEAQALNVASQDRFLDFGGQQEERASSLGDYFADQKIEEGQSEAAAVRDMLPQSGSKITVREEQKKRGEASDFTSQQGAQLGNLRAFGDLLGGIGREQARDAGLIGQIGGFKRGSSGVVPLELDQANRAGDGMRMFADILGVGGSLGMNAGLSGGSLFGGAARAPDPWAGMRSSSLVGLY